VVAERHREAGGAAIGRGELADDRDAAATGNAVSARTGGRACRRGLGLGRGAFGLAAGRLRGAALDVYVGEFERAPMPALWADPRVVITPHDKEDNSDGEGYYIRDGIVVIPKNSVIPAGTRI
jgi:hypothetical protein